MASAISATLKTSPSHNLGVFSKVNGFGSVIDRHQYSAPSGSSYHHIHQQEHYPHKIKAKRSIALSALTLLAFLFFINILQNCIQDHMDQMQPPEVIVVTTPAATAALISRYREADDQDFVNTSRADKASVKTQKKSKMTNGHSNNAKNPFKSVQ